MGASARRSGAANAVAARAHRGQYAFTDCGGSDMRILRWLAVIPAALGLVFLFFALVWTEWPQLLVGVALLALAALVWRVFAGYWPGAD
jgi:hypothetical protein